MIRELFLWFVGKSVGLWKVMRIHITCGAVKELSYVISDFLCGCFMWIGYI